MAPPRQSKADELDDKQVMSLARRVRKSFPTKEKPINGKRVDIFSGKRLVSFLVDNYSKEAPTRDDAEELGHRMIKLGLFHRVRAKEVQAKRKDGSIKTKKVFSADLHPASQVFTDSPDELYGWILQVTSYKAWLLGGGILLAIIAVVLMPLWPSFIREKLSYVSWAGIGLLGLLIALELARVGTWGLVWAVTRGGYHFWIFPRLNDETLGFWESWTPLYSIQTKEEVEREEEEAKKKSNKGGKTRKSSSKSKDSADDEGAEKDSDSDGDKTANNEDEADEPEQETKKEK